jgi:lysophospholipase L1-like esterase
MNKTLLAGLVLAGFWNLIQVAHAAEPFRKPVASFAAFDQRARSGQKLNVVFFGASLTWGANASDPQLTSYRADVARRFETAYPKAHFRFWDAAIGGTGSQLGVFRLDRDVLRRHPDLVFLDFSANDDINTADPQRLASYEALVRQLVVQGIPTVQVIFPFQWNIGVGEMPKMKGRDAHLAISRAYNTGLGDAIALITQRVQNKNVELKTLWPIDGVHPGDKGYELFAEAAWQGYQKAVQQKAVCRAPEAMLNASTYMQSTRARISQLGTLPQGWKVGIPNRTSAFFDFLMSRWLDDEVIASPGAQRLQLRFRGETLLIFGEATMKSGAYRIIIDGGAKEPVQEYSPGTFGKAIGGNGHHVQVIATGLAPDIEHILEIEPVLTGEQELRLESVCVAGRGAQVMR